MKSILRTLGALIVLTIWLGPILAAVADFLGWMLLNHGVTGIDWEGQKPLFLFMWTWVFGYVAAALLDS